jgi:5'-3' exonuclease
MGVRGLQRFVKEYSIFKSIDDLLDTKNAKLRIGIDISFYIYRWQGDIEKILEFIRRLQSNKHQVLLAFDGRAEDGKIWEAQRRRENREQELKNANDIKDLLKNSEDLTQDERISLQTRADEHEKRGWSLSKDLRLAIRQRLYEEKIPMVKAKGEADGLLAAASSCGDLDIVISGDMDLLAMGSKILWTPSDDGYNFLEFNREIILQELNLGDWQFRSLCALCFTEASEETNKINILQAYQLLKVYRNITNLKNRHPGTFKVWPEDNHIFYRSVDVVEPWLREDQINIYKAYLNYEPMPYT